MNTYITLFEYVVKPILMYGCEVWGASMKEERNFEKLGEEAWERFHLRVCKNILGVHKYTSNVAVLSEIGRYPISHDIHKQMVKYLLRFDNMAENRIAKKCIEEQKQDHTGDHWLTRTKTFLDKLGLSYIHHFHPEETTESSSIKRLAAVTKNRENDIFEQNLVNILDTKTAKNKGKLIFFSKLREKFAQADYLNMTNATYRKKITQLRLSAHKLEIEVGRQKTDMGRDERICMHCRKGEVESEEHFLFDCPNYTEEREVLMANLISHDDRFNKNMGGIELLREIFSSGDHTIFTLFGKSLNKYWEIRNLMCSNFPTKTT